MGLFNWLKGRSLKDALSQTKKIKIRGVIFIIRRINMLDYLNGSNVMMQVYSSYKTYGGTPEGANSDCLKRAKKAYIDVFMSSVIKPKLSRDNKGESPDVNEIFNDWEMASILLDQIIKFSFGKKKIVL